MKFLLDTHTLLWYFQSSKNISLRIKQIIDDPQNDIFICYTSIWEIAIKLNINRLTLDFTVDELLYDIHTKGFDLLQIRDEYLINYVDLPYIHGDPFDRILIMIAICEDLTLITADKNIQKYDVKWVW